MRDALYAMPKLRVVSYPPYTAVFKLGCLHRLQYAKQDRDAAGSAIDGPPIDVLPIMVADSAL